MRQRGRGRQAGSSWHILRAVVVGLEDLDLADAHARVVEPAAQLLAEKARELFSGRVLAALLERRHLVDVLVVEAGARLDRGPLERGEVEHVARAVELARLGVDQHPVVVAVEALTLRLGETSLMSGAEPELLGDSIHAGVITRPRPFCARTPSAR